jgi:hypothetical protein
MFSRVNSLLRAIEVNTRLTTNPRYSVTLLAAQKLRVLIIYAGRTLFEAKLLNSAHRHTKKVKGTCGNKDALIIAGGPSVNRLNVQNVVNAQARGELDVFALNWYPLGKIAEQLKPDYFCLSDPINKPGSKKAFKGNNSEIIWDYLDRSPKTKLLLPHNWMNLSQAIKNEVAIWLDDRELVGWSKSISPTKPRGYSSVTAHKTLACALFLGYQTIHLVGLDNSVFKNVVVNENNELGDQRSHFYDSESTPTLFHNESVYPFGMQDYLYNHSCLFLDLRKSFPIGSIINLDHHSMTDSFKKSENQYIYSQQSFI